MSDKLLFRALSSDDMKNIKINNGIKSRLSQPIADFGSGLDNAALQVSSGSKNETHWISTSKNFFICAEEYSIPQMGNYNLARCRRKIAIISRNIEIAAPQNYNFNNINCTYIKFKNDILDLGDHTNWPNITKIKNKYCFQTNPCRNNLRTDGWHVTLSEWSKFRYFDKFIFDLSPDYSSTQIFKFANKTHYTGNYAPLHLLSLRRLMMDAKLITNKIPSPIIACSKSFEESEVLFANSISNKSILKTLSFEEIDFLYAFKNSTYSNGHMFITILNKLLSSGLAPNCNSVFVLDKLTNPKIYPTINPTLLQDFDKEKNSKRLQLFNFINSQLKSWNITVPFNNYHDVAILDDAICVAQIGGQTSKVINKGSKFLYDILAILDSNNNVISYQNSNYNAILNKNKNNLSMLENTLLSRIIF